MDTEEDVSRRPEAIEFFGSLSGIVAGVRKGAKRPMTTRPKELGRAEGGWRQHEREGHLAPGLAALKADTAGKIDPYFLPGSVTIKEGLTLACADADRLGSIQAVIDACGEPILLKRKEEDPERGHLWYLDGCGVGNGLFWGDVNGRFRHLGEWRGLTPGETEGVGMRLYPGELVELRRKLRDLQDGDYRPLTKETVEPLAPPPWGVVVKEAEDALAGLPEGERNPALLTILNPLSKWIDDRDRFEPRLVDAYALCFSPGESRNPPQEIAHALDTIRDRPPKARRKRKSAEPEGETGRLTIKAGMTEAGLREALQGLGFEIRYDTRSSVLQLRHAEREDGRWVNWDKFILPFLVMKLAAECSYMRLVKDQWVMVPFRLTVPKLEEWTLANILVANARVDAFLEYLRSCKVDPKGPQLAEWMHDIFGLSRCPYHDWHARYPWLRAAELALSPGQLRSIMPVWLMPTGTGKSTAFGEFAPPGSGWVSESLDMELGTKEKLEAILGVVWAEAADFNPGMNRRDLAKAKAFITKRNDGGTRLAYDRRAEDQPRRVVLIATSDKYDGAIPNDANSVRRFPVVSMPRVPTGTPPHCTAAQIKAYFERWRDHFLALALQEVEAGATAELPPELWEEAALSSHRHQEVDFISEDLVMGLDKRAHYRMSDLLTMLAEGERPGTGLASGATAEQRASKTDLMTRGGASGRLRDALNKYGWAVKKRRLVPFDADDTKPSGAVNAHWWTHPDGGKG